MLPVLISIAVCSGWNFNRNDINKEINVFSCNSNNEYEQAFESNSENVPR
jgi:hypothetical protein